MYTRAANMFKMAKNWSGMYNILFTYQVDTLKPNFVGRQDCETIGPRGRHWC